MQIDSSYSPALTLPDRSHGHQHGGARAQLLSTSLRASQTQQASIEVLTAEGDRVSLSTHQQQDLSLDRFEARLRTAAGRAHRLDASYSSTSSSSISLQVEGDLNEQELADIHALIEDMDKMGDALLSGTLDTELQLGSSLAFAQGELSFSREVTASVSRESLSLRPGRAQRRAARQAGEVVRRHPPERAPALRTAIPRAADRVFDRLGEIFGQPPAESARAAFKSLLTEELNRAEAQQADAGSEAAAAVKPLRRSILERYFGAPRSDERSDGTSGATAPKPTEVAEGSERQPLGPPDVLDTKKPLGPPEVEERRPLGPPEVLREPPAGPPPEVLDAQEPTEPDEVTVKAPAKPTQDLVDERQPIGPAEVLDVKAPGESTEVDDDDDGVSAAKRLAAELEPHRVLSFEGYAEQVTKGYVRFQSIRATV